MNAARGDITWWFGGGVFTLEYTQDIASDIHSWIVNNVDPVRDVREHIYWIIISVIFPMSEGITWSVAL